MKIKIPSKDTLILYAALLLMIYQSGTVQSSMNAGALSFKIVQVLLIVLLLWYIYKNPNPKRIHRYKTILLSDIPVHREQMNMKCKLFDPHNPEELAQLISEEMFIEHNDNIEFGIADMHKRAKEYSKGFERLLRDREGRNRWINES